MAAEVLGRAVDHKVGSKLEWLLEIGRGKRVIHSQEGAGPVSQVGKGGNIEDLQERIGRRFNPDKAHRRSDDAGKTGRAGIFGVACHQAPRFEDALQQPIGAAVQISGTGHLVSRFEEREHGRGRCQSGCEGQATFTAFQRGKTVFQGGSCRVAGARVFVALVLARCFLGEGGSGVNGQDGCPGGRIGFLAGVDGSCCETVHDALPLVCKSTTR